MININKGSISNDGKTLLLEMSTDSNFTELTMWTHETFKDYTKSIDLSHYLEQTGPNESILIKAEDLGLETFNGLVFIEASDDSTEEPNCSDCANTKLVILTSFIEYYKCISDLLNKLSFDNCGDMTRGASCCDPTTLEKVELVYLMIEGIKLNLSIGKYNVAVEYMRKLKRLCKNCNLGTSTAKCLTCN